MPVRRRSACNARAHNPGDRTRARFPPASAMQPEPTLAPRQKIPGAGAVQGKRVRARDPLRAAWLQRSSRLPGFLPPSAKLVATSSWRFAGRIDGRQETAEKLQFIAIQRWIIDHGRLDKNY